MLHVHTTGKQMKLKNTLVPIYKYVVLTILLYVECHYNLGRVFTCWYLCMFWSVLCMIRFVLVTLKQNYTRTT